MGTPKMSISARIADTIKKTTALNNKTRLRIVLAIFNSEVLKIGYSLTLSQLEKMLNTDKHELAYHLIILKEAGIIRKVEYEKEDKKKTYYRTTDEGIELLEKLGITDNKIKELSRELVIRA